MSLWDGIIPAKEYAQFGIHTTNKYHFDDQASLSSRNAVFLYFLSSFLGFISSFTFVQGSNLRGREYNLTLHWHVMPKTGKMFADKLVMSGFRFPEEYR